MKKFFILTFFISVFPLWASLSYSVEISKKNNNCKLTFTNPIFNPSKDQSADFTFSDKDFSINISYSEKPEEKDPLHLAYQLDWKRVQRFSFTAQVKTKHFYISNKGLGFEQNLSLKNLKFSFKETMSDEKNFSFTLNAGNALTYQIQVNIGKKNDYGGKNIPISINNLAKFNVFDNFLSASSVTQIKEETGKFCWTEFTFSHKNISVSSTFERTEGKPNGFTKPEFSISFDNVFFQYKNKKFYLTLRYKAKNLTISINQRGDVTLDFKFSG